MIKTLILSFLVLGFTACGSKDNGGGGGSAVDTFSKPTDADLKGTVGNFKGDWSGTCDFKVIDEGQEVMKSDKCSMTFKVEQDAKEINASGTATMDFRGETKQMNIGGMNADIDGNVLMVYGEKAGSAGQTAIYLARDNATSSDEKWMRLTGPNEAAVVYKTTYKNENGATTMIWTAALKR